MHLSFGVMARICNTDILHHFVTGMINYDVSSQPPLQELKSAGEILC